MTMDQIFGSLLGLVLADALGARFEGLECEQLRERFPNMKAALEYTMQREYLRYTDDGQMAIALASYLTKHDSIETNELMREFVQVYEPWRGYGRGARAVIEAFRDEAEYEHMAEHLFPGGSLGNGGAMRSAPVGLRFHSDYARVWAEAQNSAYPTHRHELGIEGAQLIALAAAVAANEHDIAPASLADKLLTFSKTTVFENRLLSLRQVNSPSQLSQFGNGIEAHESVVTALGCFALFPTDFDSAVALAIWQGGDTDTIAAMTGALVGAHVGSEFAHRFPLNKLEEGAPFIDYLQDLSEQLSSAALKG
ncbi:MAG: ADP-ribosylglycohydrolase family protein [Planctomycetota bacterium]